MHVQIQLRVSDNRLGGTVLPAQIKEGGRV